MHPKVVDDADTYPRFTLVLVSIISKNKLLVFKFVTVLNYINILTTVGVIFC